MVGTGGRWIGDAGAFHAEGAYWDAVAGVLRYVDMLAGDVVTVESGGVTRVHLDAVAALIRRRVAGGFVVAVERGFALLDDELTLLASVPVFDDAGVRMNEGSCDPRGRLYCGSMAYDVRSGAGSLYRLDPDRSVHVALEGVSLPNGLVWTDGGATALHADTLGREVRAYEVDPDTGVFGRSRPFLAFDDVPGAPDGMALDAEGGLWVAMWGGGAVRRYDPRGRLDAVVPLPVTNVTSCAFGGEEGTTLFVTTSREGVAADAEPFAGRVHEVEVGVRGAAVHSFAG